MEIKNALIKSITVSKSDHGILTVWLNLDYGGSGQGFGGYALFAPHFKSDVCGLFLWRCMEVAGVETLDSLKGQTIRVKSSHSSIEAIGHILKDIWFNPVEEFKQRKEVKENV